jgi:hypothetical protein
MSSLANELRVKDQTLAEKLRQEEAKYIEAKAQSYLHHLPALLRNQTACTNIKNQTYRFIKFDDEIFPRAFFHLTDGKAKDALNEWAKKNGFKLDYTHKDCDEAGCVLETGLAFFY